MVLGGGAGAGIMDSQHLPSQSSGGWGASNFCRAIANAAGEICFDGGGRSRPLAGLQRRGLSKSAGICERAVLGESDRAKDRDCESGERKSLGRGLVFSESGRTERGGIELARPPLAGPGLARRFSFVGYSPRPGCIAVVDAVAVLCIVGSVWERADFCPDLVAI